MMIVHTANHINYLIRDILKLVLNVQRNVWMLLKILKA